MIRDESTAVLGREILPQTEVHILGGMSVAGTYPPQKRPVIITEYVYLKDKVLFTRYNGRVRGPNRQIVKRFKRDLVVFSLFTPNESHLYDISSRTRAKNILSRVYRGEEQKRVGRRLGGAGLC